jgi:catechol 2,3-dioxygenase-like lactoylglutathione lyase family enzyme
VERGGFFEFESGTRLIVAFQPNRKPSSPAGIRVEFETDDVPAAFDRAKNGGLKIVEGLHPTHGGSTAFVVEDPDGLNFRIGSRWPL